MPEPVPTSSTAVPGRTCRSRASMHSRVVSWTPVPNAIPGFTTTRNLPAGAASSRHSGTRKKRSPTSIGCSRSRADCTQSRSSSSRIREPGYMPWSACRRAGSSKKARTRVSLSSAMPAEPCSHSSAMRTSRSSAVQSISREYMLFQVAINQCDRQPHHVEVAAIDLLYKLRSQSLDRVRPGFVHGLAGIDVVLDLPVGHRHEPDLRHRPIGNYVDAALDANTGEDLVPPPAEQVQRAARVLRIRGLSKHFAAHHDGGIRAEDGVFRRR